MDLTDLTVREVNIINRRIGADAMQAVAEGSEHRWTAVALAQWLLAKRTDPDAAEDTYLDMTIDQIQALHTDDTTPADDGDEGPTAPTPSP